MDKQNMDKYNYDKQPQIIKQLELTGSVRKQLQTYPLLTNQLDYLIAQNEQDAAIKLLSSGLPTREAIWWSYLIVNQADDDKDDVKAHNTLRLIDNWVKEPTEEKRRLAEKAVQALTLFSPVAWVAQAIFMSGGSISPIGQFEVQPSEFAYAECAATAMIMVKSKAADSLNETKKIIRSGLHIAMGGSGRV